MNKRKALLKTALVSLLAMIVTGSLSSAFAAVDGYKQVSNYAGSGEYGEENAAAASASFRNPRGIALLADGTLLVADTDNHLIRSVKNGQVSTFAGITLEWDALGQPLGGLVDGTADMAIFQSPADIEIDASGNVFVADAANHVIRKIDTDGNVTVYAGDPIGAPGSEDGFGTAASFNYPSDLVVADNGVIYVADTLNHAIRRISPTGYVSTLNAIDERPAEVFEGWVEPAGDFKDGKLAEALFNEPSGLALDAKGNLFVSDSGNQRIRYIDFAEGVVTTAAGNNHPVAEANALYAVGDYADGNAEDAKFDFPRGLEVTPEGGLLIADSLNHAIRYLHEGKVTTVVGTVQADFGDVDGTERTARLQYPTDVEWSGDGAIYVADSYNGKIRIITDYKLPSSLVQDGSIHVVLGGSEVVFDAKPLSTNNRVMVPVRAIAEALGYTVVPTDADHVTLSKADTTIELTLGSTAVKTTINNVEGQSVIDAPAFSRDNRTYVPVRFIAEQLNMQVDWDAAHQTVIIR